MQHVAQEKSWRHQARAWPQDVKRKHGGNPPTCVMVYDIQQKSTIGLQPAAMPAAIQPHQPPPARGARAAAGGLDSLLAAA